MFDLVTTIDQVVVHAILVITKASQSNAMSL
jgi:hypothetical protein